MHTYELYTQNTLKTCHHELRVWEGTIRSHGKYGLPHNPILYFTQHFTKESQLHTSILSNYNDTKLEFVTYYSLHADSLWIGVRNLIG